ncbi:prepilin-type N-terminal cleavage/methylation domain-containing protein [Clostridium sp. DL1XJH146]
MRIKKQGLTLIELIITLAILTIILGVISNFFVTNYKQLNFAENKADLQGMAQKSIVDISNTGRESSGIKVLVGSDGSSKINETTNQSISIITFTNNGIDKTYTLSNGSLTNPKGTVIAENVEYLKIEPISGEFINCKGINIEIKLKKDDDEVVLNTGVYFRN